jgi:hypothetical protein
MDGSFGETGEDSGQVFAHGDVHPSAGFDDRENGGDFGSGLLTADVEVGVSLEFDSHGASAAVSRSVLRCLAVILDVGSRRLRPPAPGIRQSLSDWPNNSRVRHAHAPA